MTDNVIEVEGVSKRYSLGEDASRQRMADLFMPWRRVQTDNQFWALRDVSFNVRRGESVGIIGANGAGKSTLLKVLSRITAPTMGRLLVRGRVGTLLEVGTGFHPELSGRQNIFLNGTILGLSYREVQSKFDEIVDFAGVEKFIDTPVKRYSSGMQVKLAFAVAVYLDPEILIVDEVLAVGDIAFQRKSIGRLNEITGREGRTVLFVSHSMDSVKKSCERVIVLEDGAIKFDGSTEDGIDFYQDSVPFEPESIKEANVKNRKSRATGSVRFTKVVAQDLDGHCKWRFNSKETIKFRIEYEVIEPVPNMAFVFRLLTKPQGEEDEIVTNIHEIISPGPLQAGAKGAFELLLPEVKLNRLEASPYLWLGDLGDKIAYDVVDDNVDLPNLVVRPAVKTRYGRHGMISLDYKFRASIS